MPVLTDLVYPLVAQPFCIAALYSLVLYSSAIIQLMLSFQNGVLKYCSERYSLSNINCSCLFAQASTNMSGHKLQWNIYVKPILQGTVISGRKRSRPKNN